MSTTRFCAINILETSTLVSARHDDASGVFPFERALNGDRRSVWKTDGTANVSVTMDCGGIKGFQAFAVLGMRKTTGSLSSCLVESSVNNISFTSHGSFSLTNKRDAGLDLGTSLANRYFRFTFTNSAVAFTIGRLFIGLVTDTNRVHSPGAETTLFQNRLEQQLVDGSVNVNTLGDPGGTFTLPLRTISGAERDQLRMIAAATGSVLLFDTEDVVGEFLVKDGAVRTLRQFYDRYDCAMELTKLP